MQYFNRDNRTTIRYKSFAFLFNFKFYFWRFKDITINKNKYIQTSKSIKNDSLFYITGRYTQKKTTTKTFILDLNEV